MITVVIATKYTLQHHIPLVLLRTHAMVHNVTGYTPYGTKQIALVHTKLLAPPFNTQPESCIICRGIVDLKHSKL